MWIYLFEINYKSYSTHKQFFCNWEWSTFYDKHNKHVLMQLFYYFFDGSVTKPINENIIS